MYVNMSIKVHCIYMYVNMSIKVHCIYIYENMLEMPVKNQLQGMLAVFEPLDRAQSKKNFEPSFVKIG
jgi:hypothetical protein